MSTVTKRVVFVCTGNTCRSPMAEAIGQFVADALTTDELKIEVASAGVAAGYGHPASAQSVQVMHERGLDLLGHSSQQLSYEIIELADTVLTMTPAHAEAAKQIAPDMVHKISPLDPVHPIADPIGQPVEVYRHVAEQLEELIVARFKEMTDE